MPQLHKLQRLRSYLEGIYEYRVQRDDDLVLPIVGSEGAGKSTLMCQIAWLWQDIRNDDPTPESVLDRMVWGERQAFKEALLESNKGQVIAVQDAAHVLYAKEAMVGEQVDVEKALLDTRINNYLILLGFQDWRDIPDGLRRRRAENVIRVVKKREMRGFYEAYSRSSLDEKYTDLDKNEWPDPDFQGRFPDLEGSDLWQRFQELDEDAKRERLRDEQDLDVEDVQKREQIKTVLRAVQPWDDERGMTYREAAKLVDYSRGWVSDRVQEWKDGNHRSLFDDEETANRPTAAD